MDIALEIILGHKPESRPEAGDNYYCQNYGHYAVSLDGNFGRYSRYRAETKVFHHQERCQGNEYAVNDKQVHGPEEKVHVEVRQSVACSTQGRHESCGDGNAGKYGPALLAAVFQDAGKAAEKGYENVVDGGGGAGLKLRGVHKGQRGQQEKHRGSQKGYAHHHKEVLYGRSEKISVIGAKGKAGADDRAHKGGHKHGADDYGRGVDVQAN